MEASTNKEEEDKAKRTVVWNNMAEDVRGDKPRRKKVLQQEYWCMCFQLGGGDRCPCSLGPFIDSQREDIPGWHDEYSRDNGDNVRTTVSQTVGTFVNDLTVSSIEVCICFVYTYAVANMHELKQSVSLVLKDWTQLCSPDESPPDCRQLSGLGC